MSCSIKNDDDDDNPAICWVGLKKSLKTSVWKVGIIVKIWTMYLLNENQTCYYSNQHDQWNITQTPT